MCAGAVLLLIFCLRNGFQGLGAGGVIVRAHARLVVVLVAQPDLETVPLRETAQWPIEDVMLLQPARGLYRIPAAADVTLLFCLNDAFRQAAPHPSR